MVILDHYISYISEIFKSKLCLSWFLFTKFFIRKNIFRWFLSSRYHSWISNLWLCINPDNMINLIFPIHKTFNSSYSLENDYFSLIFFDVFSCSESEDVFTKIFAKRKWNFCKIFPSIRDAKIRKDLMKRLWKMIHKSPISIFDKSRKCSLSWSWFSANEYNFFQNFIDKMN